MPLNPMPLLRRAVALAALLPLCAAAQQPALALLPVGPGYITGLSDDGLAATGQLYADYQTFRWSLRDGLQPLGRGTFSTLSIISGMPTISGDGKTIGSTVLDDSGSVATFGRWTVQGGWQQLAPPLPPGGGVMDQQDSGVFGMSRNGQVVTGLFWRPGQSGGSAHGAVWTAATQMVDMGSDGYSSRIDGASADGSVLAGWDEHPSYGTRRAAVWVNGVKTILDPSDWPSEAAAVNGAGTLIVGQSADPANNYRETATLWAWDGSQWQRRFLGVVPDSRANSVSYASGLSDDGRVIVGSARRNASKPTSVGFVWTEADGMMDAMDYLKARGHDLHRKLDVFSVPRVTPDGRSLAINGTLPRPPYAVQSLIARQRQ